MTNALRQLAVVEYLNDRVPRRNLKRIISRMRNDIFNGGNNTISNDMPEAGGGGESVATPAVAADDDDDDDDGGADSDPDGRPRPNLITPALFTFAVLERYVSLNRTRVYGLIRQGKFPPPIKIGKSSRWQRSAVDGWIAAQARSTAAQG